ncbi:MAG: hypothetical protein HY909_28410 [Deltaproteobacteria bacterium]|nr:hypothetical protein [Deltaproteobacteria bacterium]
MATLDDAALTALLDLSFEHACSLPLSSFVDVETVLEGARLASTEERARRWQARLWIPLRGRLLARQAASAIPLSAWLPEDVAKTLAERLGAPAPLPRGLVDELVGSDRVREAVRAMLQDALTGFVTKATATLGVGNADEPPKGALRGALGWGARSVAAAGKGLLGGLGDEVQKQLQGKVRDFVDQSVAMVQDRIAERLGSEDTARALGKRRRRFFEKGLTRTEAQATEGLRKVPWDQVDALSPRVVAHNAAREALTTALREELTAVLAELSSQPLGALLDELGARDLWRDAHRAHGLPFLRGLVATEGFRAWWQGATAERGA